MKQEVTFKRFAFALFSVAMQIVSVYMLLKGETEYVLATVTFGDSGAPSDIVKYFDALMTQSLPYYKKKMTDNIGTDNAVLDGLMKSDAYKSYAGGTDIEVPLMYALPEMDWYDGADELPDGDIDGVTMAIYVAVQGALPVQYTMKDLIRNKNGLQKFATTKLKQAQMGIGESFAKALLHGAGEGALATPRTGASGASAVSPIHKLIAYDPTTVSCGNIPTSATWWRNKTKSSVASTLTDFLLEIVNLYNSCSLGSGGSPTRFLTDQVTFELVNAALYLKYRQINSDPTFNFNNTKLPFGNGRCLMVLDEKMVDVENGLIPAAFGGAGLTKGSGIFVNTDFMDLYYIEGRDFEMLEDENGNTFVKPTKGDSRLGHIGWMGELTASNRRKQGVLYGIDRTMTNS